MDNYTNEYLNNLFSKKTTEIVNWDPKQTGEIIVGEVKDLMISKTYGTPFLVMKNAEYPKINVFIKSGLISAFEYRHYFSNDEGANWSNLAHEELLTNTIAIQFLGEQINPTTKRTFNSFKILFPDELEQPKQQSNKAVLKSKKTKKLTKEELLKQKAELKTQAEQEQTERQTITPESAILNIVKKGRINLENLYDTLNNPPYTLKFKDVIEVEDIIFNLQMEGEIYEPRYREYQII